MKLFTIGTRLGKKFAWELTLFNFVRKFSDGVTLADIKLNIDLYEGDHNPKFELSLCILNTNLIEFNIYSVDHLSFGAVTGQGRAFK